MAFGGHERNMVSDWKQRVTGWERRNNYLKNRINYDLASIQHGILEWILEQKKDIYRQKKVEKPE